jgi:hypothetical protein
MNKQDIYKKIKTISVILSLFLIAFVLLKIAPEYKGNTIVKDFNIKQISSLPGEPIKWIKTVSISEINENNRFVEVPKIANNVKVSTTVSNTKTQLSLTNADRIKLSQLSKERSNSEASLALVESVKAQKAKGFFASINRTFSKVGSMFATVDESITEPEMVPVDVLSVVETPEEVVPTVEEETSSTTEEIIIPTEEQSTSTEEVITEESTTTTEEIISTSTEETIITSGGGSSSTEEETESTSTPIIVEGEATTTDLVAVEYETPAPTIAEAITDTGKVVSISSEESEVPITNVLAFTNIPEIYKVGQEDKIKIKWSNNNDQNVTFKAYDLNNNGKLDYVEWIVPHLSTQTFEIIFISKAFQLDANKEIISDIYDTVKTQDGIYAPISDGQYIRVTFEKILTNKNDITIYAKPTGPTPVTIEAYTTDNNQLVATFNITEEGLYKQLIPDLQNSTDVFDLKIAGEVEIDYVVDPTAILVAYYDMNDTDGTTVIDSSGNSYTGTGTYTPTTGVIDGAMSFNGSDNSVDLGTSIGLSSDFSISLWINPSSVSLVPLVTKWDDNSGDYRSMALFIDTGKIYFAVGEDGSSTYSGILGTSILSTSGDWVFITAIFNPTNNILSIYKDGILEATQSISITSMYDGLANFKIGSVDAFAGSPWYFSGDIDDVRIYNGALTQSEIDALYAMGSQPAQLVAHYTMDDTDGITATDSSVNNYNGSGTYTPTTGVIDGAMSFNGTSDNISVTDNTSLDGMSSLTLSQWVYSDSPGPNMGLVGKSNGYLMGIWADTDLIFHTWTTDNGYDYLGTPKEVFTTGEWNHVVAVWDGNNKTIYVNGVVVATKSGVTGTIVDDSSDLKIGIDTSYAYNFLGSLDDVRIYNGALTQSEIDALYASHPTQLVAHYTMNDTDGTTIIDSSGRGNTGTGNYVSTTGVIDGAIDLSNSNYITLSSPIVFGDNGTINLWVENYAEGMILMGGTGAGSGVDRYLYWYTDGNIYIGSNTFPEQVNWSSSGINFSGWHMISITKTGTTVDLLIDGVSQGTKTLSTLSDIAEIGRGINTIPDYNYSNTKIDDLRIYNGVLSQSEIDALYAGGAPSVECKTITTDEDYTVETFRCNDTFTIDRNINAEVLVVAGGGAGGQTNAGNGGGGGGGGLIYETSHPITSGDYPITVGTGGLISMPSNGGNSTFDTLTAIGGGYGGSYNAPVDETYGKGSNGGSGGGAAQFGGMSWVTAGSGTLNQGNSGAPEIVTEYYYTYGGGGGGGAGEVGHNPIDLYGSYENGGAGGNGLEYSISGTPTYYAGGGAGSSHGSGSGVSLGGSGGGGNGQYNGTAGTDGTDGLGGGGGGGGENTTGGNGGDGVVIIRYLTNTVPPDTTPPTGTMTLGSGDTYWITNTSPTINLTTDDADQYQLCLNSAIAGSECTSVAQAWASYIATPTPYDFTSQGTKTLYVQFKDTTGNISETYSDSITIDYTSPVITVSSPTNNTTYTTTSINFDVSATDETSLGSIIPDLDSSLVSWWRMDDIDGSILTDYMGNNDGTISGVSQTTGKFGKGMSFNGSGFINNGNPVNLQLQSFTALAWIKPNAQDYGFIFSYAPTGSSGWGMVYGNLWVPGESGNHYLHFDDAWVSDVLRYDIDLHDGNYHQVGIYRDTENNVGLIIDGQIVNSGTYSGIFGFDDFYIGSRDGNDNFSGSIDDVMVFNRAISADELIALYNGTAINYNSTLTEGTYTYKAYAQDTAGNVASSTLSTFNIDFTSPTGGSITYTNGYNTSPTITYTLGTDDISGINNSSGKIQRAGATLSNNVCSSFSSFSDLVTEYDGSYIDTTVVGGNCYKYQYLISDNIGNTATYTSANIVKIDVTLPTTSDNYTNNNIWQITSQTITLTPTDLGGSGLAWTKYCISTTDDCVVSSGTDYISPVNTFPEGINYFRYASVDNAGNTQATVSKIVKLDTSNPLVDIGINKTRTSTYTQTSTTSDVISGVASYLWSSDINVTFGATTSESTTIFASTDGDHIIRLTVTDVAGNSAYDEYTLTWDTTPPVVSNISPAEGTTISRNNQVIDFTISENGGCRLSTTNKSYDDMSADVSCTSNSLLISCTLPNFTSSGEKDIYIACNDSYNNADTASTTSHISYRVRSSGGGAVITTEYPTTVENIFNINTPNSTDSKIVTINITPNSDTKLIVISNNPDFNGAITIPVQTTYDYNLCQSNTTCPDGDYTIYARSLDITGTALPVVSTTVSLSTKSIIEKITDIITEVITPTPEVILPPVSITEEEQDDFNNNIDEIIPSELIDLSYNNLPTTFRNIVSLFPDLSTNLQKINITAIDNDLSVGKVLLPGISEYFGLSLNNVLISNFTSEQSKKLPADLIFARTADESIDLNVKLSVSNEGLTTQTLSTIQGQPLKFVVKPDTKAKRVDGYLMFQAPYINQTASVLDATEEQELVVNKFDYKDNGNGVWTAEVVSPYTLGQYELKTVISFEDKTKAQRELNMIVLVDPEGYIYKKIGDEEVRIKNSVVSIFWMNPITSTYELWPGDNFKQKNPQTTDVTGRYSFLVPTGDYYITVKADGYNDYQSESFKVEESKGVFMNVEMKEVFSWSKMLGVQNIIIISLLLIIIGGLIFYVNKKKITA